MNNSRTVLSVIVLVAALGVWLGLRSPAFRSVVTDHNVSSLVEGG